MQPSFEELKQQYSQAVTSQILSHNLRVVEVARGLAQKYGVETGQAELAALLHDVAWEVPSEKLLAMAEAEGLEVNLVERHAPILLHGPVGAVLLRRDYGVTDEAVLQAVRYHTTGRSGAGLLELITFLADKIEPAVELAGVEEVRFLVGSSLEKAAMKEANCLIVDQLSRGYMLHPHLIEMRNWLIDKLSA